MATPFRLKRSAVADRRPTTTDLQLGELALNTHDGFLYAETTGVGSTVSLLTPWREQYGSPTSIYYNHRVGIGSTNPTVSLDVVGDTIFQSDLDVAGIATLGSGGSGQAILQYQGSTKLQTQNWGTQVLGTLLTSNFLKTQNITSSTDGKSIFLTNTSGNLLEIGHASSNSFITGHVGNISINAPQVSISTNFSVGGISTFTDTVNINGVIEANSNLNVDGNLDVDGHTELDNLRVSGVSTFGGALDINSNIDVDGHTELDDLRVSGVSTFIGAMNVANGSGVIEDAGGQLKIKAGTFNFRNNLDNKNIIFATGTGGVILYNQGQQKLETLGFGATVYGTTQTQQLNVSGISTFSGITTVTGETLFTKQLSVSGVSTFSDDIIIGLGATVGFGTTAYFRDNVKAVFGDDEDLSIYHDGEQSILSENGTGGFRILTSTFRVRNAGDDSTFISAANSYVSLNHDGDQRLKTTEEGILVSGGTTTGTLSVTGVSTFVGVSTFNDQIFTNKISNSGIITSNMIHLTGGSFTAPHASGETKSDTAIIVNENFGIYSLEITGGGNDNRFLRSIIRKNSDVISIGQSDTALISKIKMIPGDLGSVSIGYSGAVSLMGVSQDGNTPNIEKLRTVGTGITVFGNTETQTLNVTGIVTATELDINGNAEISGDLTLSKNNPTILLSDTNNNPDYQIGNINGLLRFQDTTNNATRLSINEDGNVGISSTAPTSKLDVVGDAKISGIVTATTFVGNLTGTASTASTVLVSDESTAGNCFPIFAVASVSGGLIQSGNKALKAGSNLAFNSSTGDLVTTKFTGSTVVATGHIEQISASGISTFSGDLDVDGRTELDITNISETLNVTGISTFAGQVGFETHITLKDAAEIRLGEKSGGDLTIEHNPDFFGGNNGAYGAIINHTGNLIIENRDTAAHNNIVYVKSDNVQLRTYQNNQSILTGTRNQGTKIYFSGSNRFETTTYGALLTGGTSGIGTLAGPATFHIDPVTVGDNTGTVVIKGNLQVDGTQTTVNSSTMNVADKNVGIASGAANDAAADGGGITIYSGDGDKTFNFESTGGNLGSSENINIATGKVYKVNNVETLSATTLGSAVVNSSLTNLGTLTSLNVSGASTFAGDLSVAENIIHTGDTNTKISFPSVGDNITFTTGGSTAVTFDENQRVGIGTADPTQRLDVVGSGILFRAPSTNVALYLKSRGSIYSSDIYFGRDAGQKGSLRYHHDDDSMRFYVNGAFTERLRITNAGNVGIGSTIPTTKLDVNGSLNVSGVSTFNDNVNLLDADVLSLGTGQDLQISHENDVSLIRDTRAGVGATLAIGADKLILRNKDGNEPYLEANDNGSVKIYYDFLPKLETSGVGVTVYNQLDTTNIYATGISTFTGNIDANGSMDIASDLTVNGLLYTGSNSQIIVDVSGGIDCNGFLDVDGHTELDNLNVSGVSTFGNNINASGTSRFEIASMENALVDGEIAHTGDTDTKIVFTDNQIDLQTGGFSRVYANNFAVYIRSGLPLGFLASSGPSSSIKSGGTNNQDLLFTTGSGNPTRMQITSSGNVGIGTNTPLAKLDVYDTNSLGIISRSGSTQSTHTNKALKVRNNSTTNTFSVSYKGQVFASGIGIGTTNPSAPLHISGPDSNSAKLRIEDNNNGFDPSEIRVQNGGRDMVISAPQDIYLQKIGGSALLTLENGHSVGIGTDNPSYKLDVFGNSRIRNGVEIDGHTELDNLNVSGVSTFAGITTVTGETLFTKQLNVAGVSTFNDVVGFSSHVNVSGIATVQSNLHIPDDSKILMGDSNDFRIYHNPDNSLNYIVAQNNGPLLLRSSNADMIHCAPQGAVTLKHDGDTRAATSSTGFDVSGTLNVTGISTLGSGASGSVDIQHQGTTKLVTQSWGIDVSGVIQGETAIQCHTNATGALAKTTHGLIHGQQKQAIFQFNSVDDKIYLINNTSDKEFALLANDSGDIGWKVIPDGAVELYHNDVKRLTTTNTGVDITDNLKVVGVSTFTGVINSTVSTGTAPFTVASTTKVTNLNADLLDGKSTANGAAGNTVVVRNAAAGFSAGDVTFANITAGITTNTGVINSQTDIRINNVSVIETALNDAVAMAIALG